MDHEKSYTLSSGTKVKLKGNFLVLDGKEYLAKEVILNGQAGNVSGDIYDTPTKSNKLRMHVGDEIIDFTLDTVGHEFLTDLDSRRE